MALTREKILNALSEESSLNLKGAPFNVLNAGWEDSIIVLNVKAAKSRNKLPLDDGLEGARVRWGIQLEFGGVIKFVDADRAAVERSEQRAGSAILALSDAFWFQEGPGVRNWQFVDEGVKLLNVSNVTKDGLLEPERSKNRVSFAEASGKYAHFMVEAGDLIMPCSGIPIAEDGFLETRAAFA